MPVKHKAPIPLAVVIFTAAWRTCQLTSRVWCNKSFDRPATVWANALIWMGVLDDIAIIQTPPIPTHPLKRSPPNFIVFVMRAQCVSDFMLNDVQDDCLIVLLYERRRKRNEAYSIVAATETPLCRIEFEAPRSQVIQLQVPFRPVFRFVRVHYFTPDCSLV